MSGGRDPWYYECPVCKSRVINEEYRRSDPSRVCRGWIRNFCDVRFSRYRAVFRSIADERKADAMLAQRAKKEKEG